MKKERLEQVILFAINGSSSHSLQVFDVTRKVTYRNLPQWYKELREYRPKIPCICAANKIDGKFHARDHDERVLARYSNGFCYALQ